MRNAIPADRRVEGMIVYQQDTGVMWTWTNGQWAAFGAAQPDQEDSELASMVRETVDLRSYKQKFVACTIMAVVGFIMMVTANPSNSWNMNAPAFLGTAMCLGSIMYMVAVHQAWNKSHRLRL